MVHKTRTTRFPSASVLAFVILPLFIFLIILFFFWALDRCSVNTDVFKNLSNSAEVKGVSTFDLSAAKTKIKDNETVTYSATVVTDDANLGTATGTIVFNLTGEGRIGEDIDGPGLCVRASELRATCTAINLPASETLVWKVPVTSKATCSQSATPTISMVATLSVVGIAPETREDTAIVTCDSAATGGGANNDDDDNGGNNGNNGNNGANDNDGGSGNDNGPGPGEEDTNGDGVLNSQDILAFVKLHNGQVKACMVNDMSYLIGALFVLFLISLFAYFTMGEEKRETLSTIHHKQ